MLWVMITAFGVGGATIFGVFVGLILRKQSDRACGMLLSFAAGVMLCAAIIGLIIPACDGSTQQMLLAMAGVGIGALCLNYVQGFTGYLKPLLGLSGRTENSAAVNKVLLFVAAIAIHNLPEGLAAGVSFGCEKVSDALLISAGIALQNIPEGMVIIPPMLRAGIDIKHAVLCGIITGLFEIFGTFAGYFIISSCTVLLPFCLGFAGGTMLFIISDEMIPDTHLQSRDAAGTYCLLAGFCTVLFCQHFLG